MELFLFILQNSSEELPLWAERLICNGALVLLMLGGCGFLWWAHWEKKKVENMEEITATCVKHVPCGTSSSRHRSYLCIFEYTYCGMTYTERDAYEAGTNIGLPQVGETCTVRIDPAHPEKPYFPNIKSNHFTILMGLAFILLPLFGIIMYNIQFL